MVNERTQRSGPWAHFCSTCNLDIQVRPQEQSEKQLPCASSLARRCPRVCWLRSANLPRFSRPHLWTLVDSLSDARRPESDVRILYIVGAPRSGSTILDQVLGSHGGFFSAGEIDSVWENGVLGDQLCACGQPFSSCPFWKRVREADPDLLTEEVATRVKAYHAVALRSRAMYQLWWRGGRDRLVASAPPGYFDQIARLYKAISSTTGGQVVVDSSKHPTYAFLLLKSGIASSMEMIHLVRDPRAVAFSMMRHRIDVAARGGRTYMPRYRPAKTATFWLEWNRTAEFVAKTFRVPCRLLKYEDFVKDRDGSLSRLGLQASSRDRNSPPIDDLLRPNLHTVGGNPVRLGTDPIRLREDDEWRTKMRRGDALAVSLITASDLLRYGYGFRIGPPV